MTDDQKMNAVLQVLNHARYSARSGNMMMLTSAQILTKARRTEGYEAITRNDILVALDYMSGTHVKKITSKNTVSLSAGAKEIAKRFGRPTKHTVTTERWKITQAGIVKLEGSNEFTKTSQPTTITVNAHNSQVIVGNQNIITGNIEVIEKLTDLQQLISESDNLELKEKQNVVADIDSVKSQLGKPSPAIDVIKALWVPITAAADAGGAAQLVLAIRSMIGF
jgi:hypothetical protein